MFAFLTLLICLLFPSADVDRDGYSGTVERAAGCDPFDRNSLPYCLPGADVPGSCSSSIPGAELEPC